MRLLGWRQGLDKKLKQARAFYILILLSTGVGVGLDFAGINPVKALYWTAVINGLLAPLPSRRNPGRRFGQETDAGPTEFTRVVKRDMNRRSSSGPVDGAPEKWSDD